MSDHTNRKLDELIRLVRTLVNPEDPHQRPDARISNTILQALAEGFFSINERLKAMAIDVSKITAAAQRANKGIDSVLAALAEAATQTAALSQQLADAIAANDPAAQQQVQTELDTLADGLNAEADKIAAATQAPADPNATGA